MLEATPSRTAMGTAFLRAVHQRFDDPPLVFDDAYAAELLPGYLRAYLRSRRLIPGAWARQFTIRDTFGLAMRAQVLVRARYAEDTLAETRTAGIGRYLILGAGLDTFALRQPGVAIDVIEIDHPATQRWKQQLLADRGIQPPSELTFLPVDFETTTLKDVWIRHHGADFISWLGTTYYLTRISLESTLRTLAEITNAGSQLVLDYWREKPDNRFNPLLLGTRIAVATQGEPMRTFFEPEEIADLAMASGWSIVENLSPSAQNQRFLAQRRDRLRVPSFAYLLRLAKS